MDVDGEAIRLWLQRPREGLDRELKSWLDPSNPADRANLVKGIMALRNRDGGMLAIGFDNASGDPIPTERVDWDRAYHLDAIQSLVSKHASQPFEVAVEWVASSVAKHPVVVVAGGLRTPVAIKLPIQVSGKDILPVGTVYFRTLAANGTPSSAPARHGDWEEIMRLCFDNRDADIGRFVRRHLSAASLPTILAAFGMQQADETLRGRAFGLLDEGERRFREAISDAGTKPGHENAAEWGSSEIALVISAVPRNGATPLGPAFLNSIYAAARSTRTGIPPWHDGRNLMRSDTQPYTKEGAYEMLLDVPDPLYGHFEFSRLDPRGRFYCRSILREDLQERRFHPEDTPKMDPGNAVARVTEAFLTGAAFARGMGAEEETTTLGFAFRWSGLKGRTLYNWNRLYDYLNRIHTARGDNVSTTFIELPLATPPSALAQYVAQIVTPLMAVFGWQPPPNFVEHFTAATVRGS